MAVRSRLDGEDERVIMMKSHLHTLQMDSPGLFTRWLSEVKDLKFFGLRLVQHAHILELLLTLHICPSQILLFSVSSFGTSSSLL